MITTEQFIELSLLERAAVVLEFGKELLDRICNQYIVKLYQVDDFYVELWYRHNGNKIDKLEAVCLKEVMPHYEQMIDISDIFRGC